MQESSATNKDIEISTNLADLPDIVGDAERIGQAIGNLLNNAIKFSKKSGKVIIETKCLDIEGKENVLFNIYYSACIIWNFCVNRLVSS
jgi:signal transduction histidine kinase